MKTELRLRVEPAVGEPFARPLDQESLVIGRSRDADLQVDDRFMSRRHTRVYSAAGELLVEDLGSRNGTLVNDRRIEVPTPVGPGDVIKISGTRIVLEPAGAPPPARPPTLGSQTQLLKDPSIFLPRDPGPGAAADAGALRRYADRLKLMNEVHEGLSGSLSLEQLLALILDRVFEHLRPEQGVILLRGDEGGYSPAASRSLGRGRALLLAQPRARGGRGAPGRAGARHGH